MAKVTAPFTPEQVVYLEIWQHALTVKPFTCCSHDGCIKSLLNLSMREMETGLV